MAREINLNSSQRDVLLQLRNVDRLADRTNERLSTGEKVNSITDDAIAYFQAFALDGRAELLTGKKTEIDQGVSAISASIDAIESVNDLLDTMKGIAESIATQTTAEKVSSTEQFNEIGNQISSLIEDASYNGINLLNSTANSLDVSFSDRAGSELNLAGADLNSTTVSDAALFENVAFDSNLDFLGVSTLGVNIQGFSVATTSDIDTITQSIDDAVSRLQSLANSYGSYVSVLESRSEFTENYISTLEEGADKLTLADLDEESANLTALQTRQELSVETLAISGEMERYTLKLLTD